MKSWIELCQNNAPKCPYCEKDMDLDHDYSDSDDQQVQCGYCDKYFWFKPIVRVVYDTHGDCRKNGEMPHDLQKYKNSVGAYVCQKCRKEYYDFHLAGAAHPKLKPEEYTVKILEYGGI